MITLKNLSFTYPDQDYPTLSKLNLHIEKGEFVLLVGLSGVGKSTLLRCLNGLVPHFSGGTLSGKLEVNGLNPVAATPQYMSRYVGFVFQDPESQFIMDRLEDEIIFALENAAIPPQEIQTRIDEVLTLLNLTPLRTRSLDTLSGGEKQRVAIATLLALRPQLLILDEPTSQLDPQSAVELLETLVRLNRDLGLTILLAEHRLERVLPYINRLLYLPPDHSPLQQGEPRKILAQIDLVPPLISLAKTFNWQPIPLTLKEGQLLSQRWLQEHLPELAATKPSSRSFGVPCLIVSKLHLNKNQHAILRGIDFSIRTGEIVVLVGRNGAGKSSLLKTLIGLSPLQQGEILLNGVNIAGQPTATIAQQIGYLPQDPNALLFADTVRQELVITLQNHDQVINNKKIEQLLEELNLSHKSSSYPRDLSVGERQRVALGAIMIAQPQVLLLDEPTRGLDYLMKRDLARLLNQWRNQGIAILLVTHDVEFAAQLADRVMLMSQGQMTAKGSPHNVLTRLPQFTPQVAHLFPETGWLTVDDITVIPHPLR